MTSFPPGEWSPLLVGHQWPSDPAMAALSDGKSHWENTKAAYYDYEAKLRQIISGPLSKQEGVTADDTLEAFLQGAEHARQVAEKNGVKESAYSAVQESMLSLRQDLTGLAEEGNKAIDDIKGSKEPAEIKVGQIVAVIQQHRALANLAAAKYGGNVLDATQSILDAEGTGSSARQFAQAHGVDVGQMYRQPEDQQVLERQVQGILGNPGSVMGFSDKIANSNAPGSAPQPIPDAPGSSMNITGVAEHTMAAPPPPLAPHAPGSSMNITGAATCPPAPLRAPATPASTPMAAAPTAPSVPTGRLPAAPTPSLPGLPTSPLSAAPPTPPTNPAQGLPPENLLQSFSSGLQAGSPGSLGADALSPAPMPPTEAQVPPAAPTVPMAGAGAPVHAPMFDTPPSAEHPSAPPVTPAPAPPPVVTGPAASSAPVTATPPPAGPLPAYGADLRPPITAASAPAAAPSPPPSAMPGSAPVHPSAGQNPVGQPAVVRQAPAPASSQPPSGITTQALGATTTGAVAGAASAEATARARLQKLVAAVARQQPRLAWAVGDRADNKTTVLVNDLASGWIPPGIAIPAAVTLLEPARRRGDLETLLGDVILTAGYTPIHYLPDEDHDEPVPTSTRPRRAPEIEELGWELNHATRWRDGLPQLAHTLAKAASAGTGVLDTEVDLLREHLATVADRVLDTYPDNVDPDEVGNWQLLAAIDALVAGDKTIANYHLAWFHADATRTGSTSSFKEPPR